METLYTFREAIPVLKNLLHLSIAPMYNEFCQVVPLLVENAPNLEALVIEVCPKRNGLAQQPNDILCHILSFLSTKEAALTSPLSQRWRNLFAFSPNLCFEKEDFVGRSYHIDDITLRFIDFLDRLLAVSGNFPVKNFSLQCRRNVESYHTNRWICNVLSRGVLEHLQVNVYGDHKDSLPVEMFTCKTLVTLNLDKGFEIAMVPENASLPALKTLSLYDIQFSNPTVCGFEALLCACPVLEELVMLYVSMETINERNCTLSCPTLQRLTLRGSNSHNLTFNTPSLAYLDYFQVCYGLNPDFNLDHSLVEVKLHLNDLPISNLKNLIKDVQILDLSSTTMEFLYTSLEAIPVLKNLLHLSIPTMYDQCCRALPLLLKNAPNLQTLAIKYYNCTKEPEPILGCLSGCSCLYFCRAKVLEITFVSKKFLLQQSKCKVQLKHFLEKLSCLELVKVYFWEPCEEGILQWFADLINHFKSSNTKIRFEFIPIS